MLGAIAGDIIGSKIEEIEVLAFKANEVIDLKEREARLKPEFVLFQEDSRFTDDTVMTIAVMDALLNDKDFARKYKEHGRKYINVGYGRRFKEWLLKDSKEPNVSDGNGAAMRVGPVGFAFDTLEEVFENARISAEASHKHEEAVKGAQAIASIIFLARKGYDKKYLKNFISHKFAYNLEQGIHDIRKNYIFDKTCQGSVPQAIIAFLESTDYEDAVRKAISIGGDSDTIACMAGGISEAYYKKIPDWIVDKTMKYLDEDNRKILNMFKNKYNC